MQKPSNPPGIWQILSFFSVALLVAAADQLTKAAIRDRLAPGQSLPVTDWLQLTHVQNSGSAFGLFPNQSLILSYVALAGIVLIIVFALFVYRWIPSLNTNPSRLTLGLMLGGITGNLIDRIRLGVVTDFINFGFWPSFNVADSAIVCSTFLMAYFLLTSVFDDKPAVD